MYSQSLTITNETAVNGPAKSRSVALQIMTKLVGVGLGTWEADRILDEIISARTSRRCGLATTACS
jgi:hypothetical protein